MSQWKGALYLTVGKNVTLKASNFNKAQQLSTNGMQQVQYQSVRNIKFQRISIGFGIWFGTRGSEVQILSPRPIFSIRYKQFLVCRPPDRKALLQITERCNLHCAHCFVSAGDFGDTIPLNLIETVVLRRLIECRVVSLTLTGGEPFVHPDILAIVEACVREGLRVGICTN